MPNTEVKLSSAENTWMETSWEDREVLALTIYSQVIEDEIKYSPIAYVGTATAVVVQRATERSEALSELMSGAAGSECRQASARIKIKYSPIAQSVERRTVNP